MESYKFLFMMDIFIQKILISSWTQVILNTARRKLYMILHFETKSLPPLLTWLMDSFILLADRKRETPVVTAAAATVAATAWPKATTGNLYIEEGGTTTPRSKQSQIALIQRNIETILSHKTNQDADWDRSLFSSARDSPETRSLYTSLSERAMYRSAIRITLR